MECEAVTSTSWRQGRFISFPKSGTFKVSFHVPDNGRRDLDPWPTVGLTHCPGAMYDILRMTIALCQSQEA